MKNLSIIKLGIGILLLLATSWSCEDPDEIFEPINPNLSADNVVGTIESAARTLNGLERQLSLTINEVIVPAELATDNYINTQTFFNQFLDELDIIKTDNDIRDLQFAIARMRVLATSGIEEIGPNDPGYTTTQESGFYMLRGLSFLFAAELFKTLPTESGGVPQPASVQLGLAIDDFTDAIRVDATGKYGIGALLARARANYRGGNKDAAVADAQAAIAADPDYVYFARFDPNNPTAADNNTFQDALFDRGSFDDLQPLPTLDFLDPKYHGDDATIDFPIAVLKIEEAHLILAEAELADDDLDGAKSIMKNIVALVATRPVSTFNDMVEGRTEDEPGTRPNMASVRVAPGPDRDFEEGLVLDRQADEISVPSVSGTSFTDDKIDALDNIDRAYEALYRLRQEIFLAEGRRVTDLGIRFAIAEREELTNSNVTPDDVIGVIPSFIEPIRTQLDAFTFDAAAGTVTITNNLNRLLSENRGSDLVVPFE